MVRAHMTLQAEIQSLVSKFANDLEALVRSAAVGAVRSALGSEGAAPRAAVVLKRSGAKPASKANVAPKALAPKVKLTVKAKPAAARGQKRVRRTPAELAATADQIATYVKANPNSRAEQIKKALGIADNQWQGPLGLLLDGKRLLARGEKRATTYNLAGASSAGNVVLLKRK
jgi:hypothetical protein